MADKQKGTVKWFNSTKGFGFITPEVPEGSEETPEDLFVHQVHPSALLYALKICAAVLSRTTSARCRASFHRS
jgi:hypothetical protein